MQAENRTKRVIVAYWKTRPENPIEVFSSLKNFCLSYSAYNYNTLNNYLGRNKIAYETNTVRIERKNVFLKPKLPAERKIQPGVRKVALHEANDYSHDLNYWLSRPVNERLAAVTLLVRQTLTKGQQMDKHKVVKRRLKI